MLLPSGDQRGFAPLHPGGSSGLPAILGRSQLRRCSGWRLVGGTLESLSPARTSHRVLTVWSASIVETVYTIQSPLGEICASLTLAMRRISAGAIGRRAWAWTDEPSERTSVLNNRR